MIQARSPLTVLERCRAVLTGGHFVYTSGMHGNAYVNKDAIYPHVKEISWLCSAMANLFRFCDIDVVVGPEKGGIILSQWTAYHLERRASPGVLAVYAEKDGDEFVIKRGYEKLIPRKNVYIVEDVLTTGGSVRKVVEAVRALNGHVIGVGAIFNRGGVSRKDLGDHPSPPLLSLVDVKLDPWNEAECPLCAEGVPINTSVGKGKESLVARKR